MVSLIWCWTGQPQLAVVPCWCLCLQLLREKMCGYPGPGPLSMILCGHPPWGMQGLQVEESSLRPPSLLEHGTGWEKKASPCILLRAVMCVPGSRC